MKKAIFFAFFLHLYFCNNLYALNGNTHRDINEAIVRHDINGFSINTYLEEYLGFKKNIEEELNKQKIWRWVREGGLKEDEPYWLISSVSPIRTVNHFHNPLTDQGLSAGESAIAWSQEDLGGQYHGNYAWSDVRKYFHDALASNNTDARGEKFAEMFRGLGQLMHLVQDMSVPEHARNDFHNPSEYEEWVVWQVNELG